jgi:hypothetical protein
MIFFIVAALFSGTCIACAETAEEYFNRGKAYYEQRNLTQAITEKAEELGYAVNPNFLAELKKIIG